MRLLLFPAIVVAAWFVSRHRGELARKSARLSTVMLATILACLAVTGCYHTVEPAATIHKWTGHAFVVAVWLFVPFAIGVAVQQFILQRPVEAIGQVCSLLLILGSGLLASFTGYLGPSYANHLVEETRNRFNVLHLFAFPGIIVIFLIVSYWFFRPSKNYAEQFHKA